MQNALDDKHQPIQAGPNAPVVAICPACGGVVTLRCRRNGQETPTWFYRHRHYEQPDCPRRTGPLR